jgi:hypothetical protein
MINKDKIKDLLRAFAARGIESPRSGLAQELKNRIPHRLICHRMDTISIIVDLRISRIAAAAAIVVALLLGASFFGGREAISGDVYRDGKLFLKYTLRGENAYRGEFSDTLATFRDALVAKGRDVVYYGDRVKSDDPHVILMHWKLSDDKYGIILGDLSARTVHARTLVRLQAHMLSEQAQ